ncbi:unnamed protein product [Fraxinus pennsylvanica]|uniref:DNA polymerase epsilon subunit B N-terminal domain-containing protein n=1 Tax=Fraxinus pennsylvanica TaxID=56036 RepID=A0AAD1ZDL1_9LAMI|nr:unnamed protein product [Fraxinus pennsylvanica]
MSGAMRNKVQRKFKMRGYTLKVEALSEIHSFVSRFSEAEDEALDLLLDELHHSSLKSSILDKESVHRVVSLAGSRGCSGGEPNKHTGKLPIHGDASAKATLSRDRFVLLFQRLSRDPDFSRPVFDTDISDYGSCQISTIQSLVGQTEKRWVMGLISQLEDGHFYLEDLTAAVEIDLVNAISFAISVHHLFSSPSFDTYS